MFMRSISGAESTRGLRLVRATQDFSLPQPPGRLVGVGEVVAGGQGVVVGGAQHPLKAGGGALQGDGLTNPWSLVTASRTASWQTALVLSPGRWLSSSTRSSGI
jgi:hypothetical protein